MVLELEKLGNWRGAEAEEVLLSEVVVAYEREGRRQRVRGAGLQHRSACCSPALIARASMALRLVCLMVAGAR